MLRAVLPRHLMDNRTEEYLVRMRQHMEADLEAVLYRSKMYRLVIPLFLFLSALAIAANLLVMAVLRSTKVPRTATATLILSLTLSDIWTSCVVSLSLLYNSYLPMVVGAHVNPCISLTLELFRTGGLLSATIHLLLISLHHFVSIVRPHIDRSRQIRVTRWACCLAWLCPVSALLLLSVSFPRQGYWKCTDVHFYNSRQFRLSVSLLLVTIFSVTTFCYVRMLCILRSNRRRLEQCMLLSLSASATRRSSTVEKNRREMRTLGTAILICSSFFCGWFPATAMFAVTCADCALLRGEGYRTVFVLSCVQLGFILAKSLLNPLIYALRIPEVDVQVQQCKQRLHKSLGNKFSRLLNSPTSSV